MQLLAPADHQPRAQAAFEAVAHELALLLPDAHVLHIGASAVPGAISKGDVDICVVVNPGAHAVSAARLQAAGYTVKADASRSPERCTLVSPQPDIDLALHLVASGSAFEADWVNFRDALRANAALVERYNALKRQHAADAPERYRAAKSRFIEGVLRPAAIPCK